MDARAIEVLSLIVGLLMYFAGVVVWPVQACVRRRWDARSKTLATVCGLHLLALLTLTDLRQCREL